MIIGYKSAIEKPHDPETEVHVTPVDDGFDIEKNGKKLEFRVSKLEFKPDMVNIFESYHELFLLWSSGNSCDKSGYFSAIFRNRGFDNNHIGSIFVDANGNAHMFTRYPLVVPEGTEATLIDYDPTLGTRSEDAFERTLPAEANFHAWNQRHRAKINFLGKISTNDSLTMLESQLDLLTQIVLAMAPDSDMKAALAEATNGNTVFSVHNLDKIKQTIQRQKNYIREKQKLYFAARGDIENADLSS